MIGRVRAIDAADRAKPETVLFRTKHLHCQMGDRTILTDLSISVPAGRMIGLVGHNGSGKSTLLRLLARQQAESDGSVHFLDRPLSDWGKREFARKVAYLPQKLPPSPGLTVRELVALGRYPWLGPFGRFTRADHNMIAEALQLSGLDEDADRIVDSLSGGERQRAWIAMLLAQDPECFLLDEPTSALDMVHQAHVLTLVRRLCIRNDISTLVVLHDPNLAARYCDEIIALRGGELIMTGETQLFMTETMMHTVYGLPIGILPHPDGKTLLSYVK